MPYKKQDSLKVDTQGRVTIPKRVVEEEGLSPGDEVAQRDLRLRRTGYTRRAFCRYVARAAGVVGLSSDVWSLADHFTQQRVTKDEETRSLLSYFVGTGNATSAALMPARDHPYKPLPSGQVAYEIESECMAAYSDRFWHNVPVRVVQGFPLTRPDDTLVLFGSQVSNQKAREHFGNPFSETPTAYAVYGDSRNPRRVNLRWNLFSPPGTSQVVRQQYGENWRAGNHLLIDFAKDAQLASHWDNDYFRRDYFLITSIPRFSQGSQRIVMFGGIHGPGTRGVTDWLRNPNPADLAQLAKATRRSPYFQALFEVSVSDHAGEVRPTNVGLVDACALDV
jgi:hypothetical protein